MKSKQNKYGLTLVEILVAIAIVAVLAAGLYSVSNYLEKQSKIELTKSTIEALCAALEQYHDFYGRFPDVNDANGIPTSPATCNDIERLYYKLSLAPDAKKILNQINRKMIINFNKDESPAIYPEIVDAWGKDFRYSYKSGDNFPVITSAGPDRDFNSPTDNISSRQ